MRPSLAAMLFGLIWESREETIITFERNHSERSASAAGEPGKQMRFHQPASWALLLLIAPSPLLWDRWSREVMPVFTTVHSLNWEDVVTILGGGRPRSMLANTG